MDLYFNQFYNRSSILTLTIIPGSNIREENELLLSVVNIIFIMPVILNKRNCTQHAENCDHNKCDLLF